MKKLAFTIVLLLLMSTAGMAVARPFGRGMMSWYNPNPNPSSFAAPGYGPRGSWGLGWSGMGPWMMGYGYGFGGFGGCPMGGYWRGGYDNQANITIDEAVKIAENYLSTSGYSDLKIDDIYEFTNHFEVEFAENSTGIHAFEILINKFTGTISPEMGPNMMWNTKYGHMYYAPSAKMSVTEAQAREIAKNWLGSYYPNLTLSEETEVYYGFYEFHAKEGGRTVAQINVNGFTGQVWFENWHGTLLNEKEV